MPDPAEGRDKGGVVRCKFCPIPANVVSQLRRFLVIVVCVCVCVLGFAFVGFLFPSSGPGWRPWMEALDGGPGWRPWMEALDGGPGWRPWMEALEAQFFNMPILFPSSGGFWCPGWRPWMEALDGGPGWRPWRRNFSICQFCFLAPAVFGDWCVCVFWGSLF